MESLVLAWENGVWLPMFCQNNFLMVPQFTYEPVQLISGHYYLVERFWQNERILWVNYAQPQYHADGTFYCYPIVEVFPYRLDLAMPNYILATTPLESEQTLAAIRVVWANHVQFTNSQANRVMELWQWWQIAPNAYMEPPYLMFTRAEMTNFVTVFQQQVLQFSQARPRLTDNSAESRPSVSTSEDLSISTDFSSSTASSSSQLVVESTRNRFITVAYGWKKGKKSRARKDSAQHEQKISITQLPDDDEDDELSVDESNNITETKAQVTPDPIWCITEPMLKNLSDILINKKSLKCNAKLFNELDKLVASGANINTRDKFKKTLLDYAIQYRNPGVIKELCDIFCATVTCQHIKQAIMMADCTVESYEMLLYLTSLLPKSKVEPLIKANFKSLLINMNVLVDIVKFKWLLSQCQDITKVVFDNNENIVVYILMSTHIDIGSATISWELAYDLLRELFEAVPADTSTQLVTNISHKQQNCLDIALRLQVAINPRPTPDACVKMLQLLVANGADLNNINSVKQHILHCAIIRADYLVIEYLLNTMLKKDVEKYINHQDEEGQTVISASLGRRQLDIVLLLLSYGANSKLANFKGKTPIQRLRELVSKDKRPSRADFEIAQALGEPLLLSAPRYIR